MKNKITATLFQNIKTPYQQKHNLPSTYAMASVGHLGGLHQIKLVKNSKYVPSGKKSYGHLMRKCRSLLALSMLTGRAYVDKLTDEITPTLATPFTVIHQLVDDGATKFLSRFKPGVHTAHGHTVTRMQTKDASGKLGDVQAEDVQQDSQYLAQVGIGTPLQHFNLDFDTGSADLWMWSTKLPKNTIKTGQSSGHNIFDPSKSSTYKDTGSTWQIQYGDGSTAKGTVGTDVVNVGGIQLVNQGVELAQSLSTAFTQGQGDGLLGLAFGSINTVQPNPVKTPVENMIDQSDIPKDAELFTAYLTNSKDNVSPCYTFGYIDQDLVNGGIINYTPIDNSQGFWSVKSASAAVNGQNYALVGNTAIIDTGTTLALIDDNTCKAIYDAIPNSTYDSNQGGYLFPTSTSLDALPTVKFAIGDTFLTLHKEDLGYADAGNGMTYGGIQSRGNMTFSIYGDTCLKGMYAIFDQVSEVALSCLLKMIADSQSTGRQPVRFRPEA